MPTVIDLSSLTADTGFVIEGASAGAIAGLSVAAGDINGDGYEDIILGAPLSGVNGTYSGAAYVIFGKASGFGTVDLGNLGTAGFSVWGSSYYAYAGVGISSGDVNGDGFDELIIGSPNDDRVDVIFGKSSGFETVRLDDLGGANGFTILGAAAASYAGVSVGNADINGDGFADVLIGEPNGYYTSTDRAFVVFGKSSSFTNVELSNGNKLFQGIAHSEAARTLASAGDFNGDGFEDIIIGAPFKSSGTGEAYVIFGKASGFTTLDASNLGTGGFTLQAAAAGDWAGASVSSAGDFNGDGYDDIIVGAPFNDAGGNNAGTAYLVFGRPGGLGTVNLGNLGTLGFAIVGGAANAGAGDSVAAGDVNGDGLSDLIVGSPGTAEVYVIYGKTSGFGTVNLGSLSDSDGFIIRGPVNDGVGNEVSAADVNGDGATDVIVGVPWAGNNTGGAYVVFGHIGVGISQSGTAATDVLVGTAGPDSLSGLGANDYLSGLAGNDILDGGAGDDLMSGGSGSDTYFVDSNGDVVTEQVGEGRDTIFASLSYALGGDAEIELLLPADQASTAALDWTGNGFDNTIYGNAGANVLSGGAGSDVLLGQAGADLLIGGAGDDNLNGGTGNDTLVGGIGNDIYILDGSGDVVVENGGEGRDTIFAPGSYVLTEAVQVELLAPVDAAGTDALTFGGNSLANIIYGNAGANVLLGNGGNDSLLGLAGDDILNGGAGADVLIGDAGDDIYLIDSIDDVIVEASGEGSNDRLFTTVTYILRESEFVEQVAAADRAATNSLNLTGNSRDNILQGNDGANILDGKGGNDALLGFVGADVFVFSSPLNGSTNVDTIVGFSVAEDKILLDGSTGGPFAALAAGTLSASAFVVGSQATTADQRIVYDAATGSLYFDADGNGAGAQVQFAILSAGLALTNSSFIVADPLAYAASHP